MLTHTHTHTHTHTLTSAHLPHAVGWVGDDGIIQAAGLRAVGRRREIVVRMHERHGRRQPVPSQGWWCGGDEGEGEGEARARVRLRLGLRLWLRLGLRLGLRLRLRLGLRARVRRQPALRKCLAGGLLYFLGCYTYYRLTIVLLGKCLADALLFGLVLGARTAARAQLAV